MELAADRERTVSGKWGTLGSVVKDAGGGECGKHSEATIALEGRY